MNVSLERTWNWRWKAQNVGFSEGKREIKEKSIKK